MIDHVFGIQYGWVVEDRVIEILRLLMRSLESYLDLRKVRKREITPPAASSLGLHPIPDASGWIENDTASSWQDMSIMSEDWNWAVYGTTNDLWNAPGLALPNISASESLTLGIVNMPHEMQQ